MATEFGTTSVEFDDAHEIAEVQKASPIDAPEPHRETLPDGQEILVIGDPESCADLNHKQGENLRGFEYTCGLVCCEGVLKQFHVNVGESDLVEHALRNGHCDLVNGFTSLADQIEILRDYGVDAHKQHYNSLERLADDLQDGKAVILHVDCGVVWEDASYLGLCGGEGNHAVLATGVARDPVTNEITGVYINDPATGESGRLVDRETMEAGFVQTGGDAVAADVLDPVKDNEQRIGWVWCDGTWIWA